MLCVQVQPHVVPQPKYSLLRTSASGASKLFSIDDTGYARAPMLVRLKGSRAQVGHDYAELLHAETSEAFTAFMNSLFN